MASPYSAYTPQRPSRVSVNAGPDRFTRAMTGIGNFATDIAQTANYYDEYTKKKRFEDTLLPILKKWSTKAESLVPSGTKPGEVSDFDFPQAPNQSLAPTDALRDRAVEQMFAEPNQTPAYPSPQPMAQPTAYQPEPIQAQPAAYMADGGDAMPVAGQGPSAYGGGMTMEKLLRLTVDDMESMRMDQADRNEMMKDMMTIGMASAAAGGGEKALMTAFDTMNKYAEMRYGRGVKTLEFFSNLAAKQMDAEANRQSQLNMKGTFEENAALKKELELMKGANAQKTAETRGEMRIGATADKEFANATDLATGRKSPNSPAGLASGRLNNIQDAKGLLAQMKMAARDPKNPNAIMPSKQAAQDLAIAIIRVQTGSTRPAAQLINKLVSGSFPGDIASATQYILGKPQQFLTNNFLRQFQAILDGEESRWKALWHDEAQKILKSRPALKGKEAEYWDAVTPQAMRTQPGGKTLFDYASEKNAAP